MNLPAEPFDSADILVVGLNPAWQKVCRLQALRPGEVHRLAEMESLASGKGVNTAQVAMALGLRVDLVQVLAGEAGNSIESECTRAGIRSLSLRAEGETRTCTTLIEDGGRTTELIEPFRPALDWEAALRDLFPRLRKRYRAVLFCGTAPAGAPPDLFSRLAEAVEADWKLLDGYLGLPPGFIALQDLVKVNRQEYEALLPQLGPSLEAGGKGPLFLVTDGPRPAEIHRGGERIGRWRLPPLSGVMNPIGAGDTVMGGLAFHLLQGKTPAEAFPKALALGMASCLELLPARFDGEVARELEQAIVSLA